MTTQRHTIALVLKGDVPAPVAADLVSTALASEVHVTPDQVNVLDHVVGIGTCVFLDTPTVDSDTLWGQYIRPLCTIKYKHEIVDVRIDQRGIKPAYFAKGW